MITIETVSAFMERFAPLRLAESWDNVGLLVGDARHTVGRLMTCLTVTPTTVAEAIQGKADLIVAHHPMPFAAAKRWTTATIAGRMLLDLVGAGVAVYSPHTAFDSAADGINQRLAAGLGLRGITALVPHAEGQGTGRCGWLEESLTLGDLAARLKTFLGTAGVQMVGRADQATRMVAVGCGAAGELLDAARQAGCDAMVTGETRFHTCLEAEAWGVGLLLGGHFATERFGVESLAAILKRQFPGVEVWAARQERDPIQWTP
jgi:dinuclear metal center YbgI/SA1388 family protein